MGRAFLCDMAVDTFEADGPKAKGSVLFLNGLPGAIGPLAPVIGANRRGWDVIFPQYPGTYDSPGELTPTASCKALAKLLAKLDSGAQEVASLHTVSPTVCIAHSFGAFQLIALLRSYPQCKISKGILLAPVVSYSTSPDYGTREDLMQHLDSVRKLRPITYRIGQTEEWAKLASGVNPIDRKGSWLHGELRCLIGTDDDTYDLPVAKQSLCQMFEDQLGTTAVTVEVVEGAGHAMHELLARSRCLDEALGTELE